MHVHYAEARWELTSKGLTLLWQFKAKYAHDVLPTPHARNSTIYTLPSQPIDRPCQYQFLPEDRVKFTNKNLFYNVPHKVGVKTYKNRTLHLYIA